jgi:hypothetical protein
METKKALRPACLDTAGHALTKECHEAHEAEKVDRHKNGSGHFRRRHCDELLRGRRRAGATVAGWADTRVVRINRHVVVAQIAAGTLAADRGTGHVADSGI